MMYLMDLWAEAKLVKWIQEEHSQFCKPGKLYNQLSQRGYVVILDNRKLSPVKVSIKENEALTEKNSSRASIFATKASYISN